MGFTEGDSVTGGGPLVILSVSRLWSFWHLIFHVSLHDHRHLHLPSQWGARPAVFLTSKLKILCWENRKSDVIYQSVDKIGISIICIESAVPLGSCYYCIPQYFRPPGNPCDYTPPSCGRLCEGHHKAFQLPGTSVLQKDNTQSNSQVTFLFKIRQSDVILGQTEKISN